MKNFVAASILTTCTFFSIPAVADDASDVRATIQRWNDLESNLKRKQRSSVMIGTNCRGNTQNGPEDESCLSAI